MKCAQCGEKLKDGMQFCSRCGAPAPSGNGQPQKQGSSSVIIGVCIAVIVIAVGALIALFALGIIGGSNSGSAASSSASAASASATAVSITAASSSSAAASSDAPAKAADTQKSNTAASAEGADPLSNESAFIGTWKLNRVMDVEEGGYWEDVRELSKLGYKIELNLKDDGMFAFTIGSDTIRGSWKATDPDRGTIHFPGETASMRIRDEKLIIEEGASKLEFQKA